MHTQRKHDSVCHATRSSVLLLCERIYISTGNAMPRPYLNAYIAYIFVPLLCRRRIDAEVDDDGESSQDPTLRHIAPKKCQFQRWCGQLYNKQPSNSVGFAKPQCGTDIPPFGARGKPAGRVFLAAQQVGLVTRLMYMLWPDRWSNRLNSISTCESADYIT